MRVMPSQRQRGLFARRLQRGFTTIEAVMVMLIVVVVVGALTPSVMRQITHARVNRAANVLASTFFLAQTLAGRQHSPVKLAFSTDNKSVVLSAASSATVLHTEWFGLTSEFKLDSFTPSSATVLVLPNGRTTTSVTVTLSDGTYSRQVRMTSAGQIRVM